jgi:hypothetical protein
MIRKIGVAALLGLMAMGAFASTAGAQCGTGPSIILNTATFGFEAPSAVTAPYVSPAGNTLTVLGLVQSFCAPFADLNAQDPNTEYTLVITGLTSGGTTHPISSLWVTSYTGGTFAIYQDSPRNAPTSAAGTLSGYNLQAFSSGAGSYSANATFTGGTLYSRVAGTGPVIMQGALCANSGCLPPAGGYSAQFDGKFDTPVTPTQKSTWGSLKILYR